MKDLALSDRPREKLERVGPAALGDNELVALLLGSGIRGRGALGIAQEVLDRAGGVHGLLHMAVDDLRRVNGVGGSRAARLVAAIELGRRAVTADFGERPKLATPDAVARYLMPLYGSHRVERCGVMLLDGKNRVIRTVILSVGTSDTTLMEPRDIFREALMASATNVVVFHNHPTGDPKPSPEDVTLTERLRRAGEVVGIGLADHIILGDRKWFSFRSASAL